MQAINTIRGVLAGGVSIALAACGFTSESARGPELPDEPGFYALFEGEDEYQRLDGDYEWEIETWPQRSDLQPYVQFVIFDPALAMDPAPFDRKVELEKVAWVRSEIDRQGTIRPAAGSKWAISDLEQLTVPVNLSPIEGRRDAVHIVPLRPLDPGLYSLQLRSAGVSRAARVGIQWSTVDKAAYSATNCVDRYSGGNVFYRACARQLEAMSEIQADGLQIHLVDPGREVIDGQKLLVIKGVIVNTTDDVRTVPTMEASLLDKQGTTLKRWVFEPQARELGPGRSLSFRTDAPRPPQATAKVHVRFASTSEAGIQ